MKRPNKELAAIHLAVLLFGSAGLFGKLLTIPALLIVLGRVAFATLALSLYLKLKPQVGLAIAASQYRLLFLTGLILAIHWVTFFHSIQISTVAIGLLSFSTFPIFVVILEPLFFNEKLSFKYIFIALICFSGIRLIISDFNLANLVLQGVIWGSVSGLLFALLTLLNRKLVVKQQAGRIALWQNFFAFLLLLPFSLRHLKLIDSPNQLFLLLILGVVFTALSHTLFIYGLKRVSAKSASIIACLEPLYGIILALLLLGEVPDVRTFIGGILIIGSVLYISISLKQNEETIVEVLYE